MRVTVSFCDLSKQQLTVVRQAFVLSANTHPNMLSSKAEQNNKEQTAVVVVWVAQVSLFLFIMIHGDAAAELERNPVSKHHIQSEYGNEQVDAGRDCLTRLAIPNSQVRTRIGKYSFFLFS